MNKNLYKLKDDEIEISFIELIKMLTKKIKFIIMIAAAVGVALPLVMFAKDSADYKEYLAILDKREDSQYIEEILSMNEINGIEQYYNYKAKIEQLEKKKEESILLNMSCDNVSKMTMQFYINAENNMSDDIVSLYRNYIENGGLASDLVEEYKNVKPELLQELYWIVNSNSNIVQPRVFEISVIGESDDECTKLVQAIEDSLKDYNSELGTVIGEHTIACVQRLLVNGYEDVVYAVRNNFYSDYAHVNNELNRLLSSFNEVQKAIIFGENVADNEMEVVEKPQISILYAIIGVIVGGCIAVALLCVRVLFNGKIQSVEEPNKRLGYKSIGKIYYKPNGFINSIFNKSDCTEAEPLRKIALKIDSYLKESDIKEVIVMGAHSENAHKYLIELENLLAENSIKIEIVDDLEVLRGLKNYKYAISIDEVGVKKVKNLYEENDVLKESNIEVIGYISMSE